MKLRPFIESLIKVALIMAVGGFLAYYCLNSFYMFSGSDVRPDPMPIFIKTVMYALPFLTVPLFCLVHGFMEPGSMERLAVRMACGVWMLGLMFFTIHELSYAMNEFMLNYDPYLAFHEISLTMNIDGIFWVLVIIPLLSMTDSVLEWAQYRKKPGKDGC